MKRCFFCLCILLCISLAGCTSLSPTPKATPDSLEQTLVAYLTTDDTAQDNEEPLYFSALEERQAVHVSTVTESDDGTVQAVLEVTSPNLYTVAKELEAQSLTDPDAIDNALCQALTDAPETVTEVSMTFTVVDGQWQPIITEEFVDAYYGGLMTLRNEFYNQAYEEVFSE